MAPYSTKREKNMNKAQEKTIRILKQRGYIGHTTTEMTVRGNVIFSGQRFTDFGVFTIGKRGAIHKEAHMRMMAIV